MATAEYQKKIYLCVLLFPHGMNDWQRDLMARLTMTAGFDGYPVWIPDGNLIAFESDRAEGVGNLYLMRADGGGEPQRLTRSKNSQTPGSFFAGRKVAGVLRMESRQGIRRYLDFAHPTKPGGGDDARKTRAFPA